ncbi:MAG: hypothetical protein IJK52_07865 [Oscillospiraceae bacterium]|nr:hypothetical protein [Oscillospiraceae bacterium]
MMNAADIWWGQIGNSLRLLGRVTLCLRDHKSAVLAMPTRFPWKERFYREIDIRRAPYSVNRRLKRIAWPGRGDPGHFVLTTLCPLDVQADYWPGQTYGEYLGSRRNLAINDYDIWVTGVHSKADLTKWADFVTRYHAAAKDAEPHAAFFIEYDGPDMKPGNVERISCQVERYDCRVFCLEMAAELSGTPLRDYQAELALSIGGSQPELCAALLETGDRLLDDPISTARQVLDAARDSYGNRFAPRTETELNSAVWLAAVALLFPLMERYRIDFIERHKMELYRFLPISNSNGDEVTEPFDLEIGALCYIIANLRVHLFTPAEVSGLRLCRRIRNQLAHNKPADRADVEAVMSL